MFYALNGNQFELGHEIYENFEKAYFSIEQNADDLVSGYEMLVLNKLVLDGQLEIQSSEDVVEKRKSLIKAVKNNYKNWYWRDDEKKERYATHSVNVIKSDMALNLYDNGSCDLALEVFEETLDVYLEELISLEAGNDPNFLSYFNFDDPVIEPTEAAICAIEKGRTEDAKRFLDLSARSLGYVNEYVTHKNRLI